MSETIPKVFNRNDLVEDAVTIFANNKIYTGWKNVTVKRQLNSVASTLNLNFTETDARQTQPWRLKPGDLIHVHLGKASVFFGYIDSLNVSMAAGTRTLTVSGRSKTADLVDCSAVDTSELVGLTLTQICQKLLAPFGLKTVAASNTGAVFTKFNRQQGETVHEIIDRLAREREILVYPSVNGNLVLSKRGAITAQAELIQGKNVLTASGSFNNSERFSEYIIKSQTSGLGGGTEAQATKTKATFKDEGITRYRPKIIVAENPVNNEGAAKRASYEANVALAKSAKVTVEVLGWYQAPGVLWDINQLVEVDLPFIGIKTNLLVSSVTFEKSDSGTKTNLELINPAAFTFETSTKAKKKEKGNDLNAFLGTLKRVAK